MFSLHAVIIDKSIPLEKAKTISKDYIKGDKSFYRETSESYRFRNIPKTKFDSKTFRSKKINDKITLVYGKLLEK
jgi:hypothetical protein